MRITMIDDSIPFDGTAPDRRPLGGAEKAFARLSAALSARGHHVTAINRIAAQTMAGDVAWVPWEAPRPPETDVLIAFRKPALLGEVAEARHRCLWVWDAPAYLARDAERAELSGHRPTIVVTGEAHRRAIASDEIKAHAITPGVAEPYRTVAAPDVPASVAVTTTHPLHGLDKIVRAWRDRIHPARPYAELHIYSAALNRALDGGDVDRRLRSLVDDVKVGLKEGIEVRRPLADPGMAEVYAGARVHLYPAVEREMYATTLAESQAAGLPAVVRADGGATAQLLERVRNGTTGYFAPDGDAVVNLALTLLDSDGAVHANLSRDARALQRARGWDAAAADFEALWH